MLDDFYTCNAPLSDNFVRYSVQNKLFIVLYCIIPGIRGRLLGYSPDCPLSRDTTLNPPAAALGG